MKRLGRLVLPKFSTVTVADAEGEQRYNPSTGRPQYRDATAWRELGGVGGLLAGCKAYNNANHAQAIGAGATVKVTLAATLFDRNGGTAHFDDANDRIYCRKAGVYRVSASLYFAGTTGASDIQIVRNGTVTVANARGANSAIGLTLRAGEEIDLAAGDYIELYAYVSVAQNVGNANQSPYYGFENLTLQQIDAGVAVVSAPLYVARAQKNISNHASGVQVSGLSSTYSGTDTIPGGRMRDGSQVRVKGGGNYNTPAGAPGVVRIKGKMISASTSVDIFAVDTGTLGSLLGGQTDMAWFFEATFGCRTAGPAGKFTSLGFLKFEIGTGSEGTVDLMMNGAETTVDTTVPQRIDITVEWAVPAANKIVRVNQAEISVLDSPS